MAKYFNNITKTGKVAGSVFSVRYGQTIERAYQPMVNNPKSETQVQARAKLKLVSQLSAIMGPYVAMPRIGAVSPRNRFVKKNYPAIGYANSEATVNLSAIQLTDSVVGLPNIAATFSEGTITAYLGVPDSEVNCVVFVAFVKQPDGKLRYAGSAIQSVAGDDGLYRSTITYGGTSFDGVVLAYGVRDNSEAATAIFGNLQVTTASEVARLIVTRVLTEADLTLTETRAALLTSQA